METFASAVNVGGWEGCHAAHVSFSLDYWPQSTCTATRYRYLKLKLIYSRNRRLWVLVGSNFHVLAFQLLLQIGLSVQPCFVLQNSLRHVNQGAHVTSFLFWLLHRPFIADTVCRAASAFPLVFSRLLLPYAQRAAFCVIKLLSYCDIAVCATVRLCA